MKWIDWTLVILVLIGFNGIAFICKRYVKSVADFLVAGRSIGKYLGMTASEANAVGAVAIMATMQATYVSGPKFWWFGFQMLFVGLIIAVTGWGVYRLRQTKCMTIGELLERRYSRKLRIFCGFLCFLAGILNMGIFPVIGGRFFVYFCGLPQEFFLFGLVIPTCPVVAGFLIAVAVFLCFVGGQVTLIVSEFVQGALMMLMYIIVGVVVYRLVTWDNITEVILAQPNPSSLVNPFTTVKFGEFDAIYFFAAIFLSFYGVLSWAPISLRGQTAIDEREAKLMMVLGNVRFGVGFALLSFLPLACFAVMKLPQFAEIAAPIKATINGISSEPIRQQVTLSLFMFQLFPIGLKGILAAGIMSAFIGVHSTYFMTWGSILVQDVVIPLRGTPLSLKTHMLLLKLAILGVALFVYVFSLLWHEVDFIIMFQMATGYIFAAGIGCLLLGALYWRRGTTPAAWSAMITGLTLSSAGLVFQQIWRNFPINGYMLAFFASLASLIVYIIVSLCTPKSNFDLDKLLHREKQDTAAKMLLVRRMFRASLVDKILWATILMVGSLTIAVVIYNYVVKVPAESWITFWKIYSYILYGSSIPVTAWFITGGIFDIRKLFKGLKKEKVDTTDNGFVREKDKHPVNTNE